MSQDLKITILSTGIADEAGIAEWGFSALVESEGHRLLFDTGARHDTVLINSQALKIDLSTIEDVVLSHSHDDHFGGLLKLRKELSLINARALSRAWVAQGFFLPWEYRADGIEEFNPAPMLRKEFEALGGEFREVPGFTELAPGLWMTGPIPRQYPERNWPIGFAPLRMPDGTNTEWVIQDDQALVAETSQGLVVLTGCGHAGIANILACASGHFPKRSIEAVIGGLHLHEADDALLDWTAERIKAFGPAWLMATHCTGLEAIYRWRGSLGMDRAHCSAGAVGARYSLAKGIEHGPGGIER